MGQMTVPANYLYSIPCIVGKITVPASKYISNFTSLDLHSRNSQECDSMRLLLGGLLILWLVKETGVLCVYVFKSQKLGTLKP